MSSNGGDSVFHGPKPSQTGLKAALQHTGIPPSWLDKRPRLPSRNWLAFLGVTSTVIGYYVYDRRQCKKIRQEYVDKVKHFAESPLHSLDYPRKVTVYGSKWPGDEDYDRSMKYFRTYVKPILVAAAVDYEMIGGRRFGDLASGIAEEIKKQRRIALGLEQPAPLPIPLPGSSPEEKQKRAVEGGIIIVGRPTFKEFMAGLKEGWAGSLERVDREEELAKILENDGRFDEPELNHTVEESSVDGEPIPTKSKLPPAQKFSPFMPPRTNAPTSSKSSSDQVPSSLNTPPPRIPPQPPILFTPFLNYIGFTQIPYMIWDFFNERHKVHAGAEGAYCLIMNQTRPFVGPFVEPSSDTTLFEDLTPSPGKPHLSEITKTDLDFDKEVESFYKQSVVGSYLSEIEKAREEYYAALRVKLETARALARRERELTKEEVNHPPPTEVELRAERLKKEMRWHGDEQGWNIIRPDKDVEWDERFRDVLKVYIVPSPVGNETLEWGKTS